MVVQYIRAQLVLRVCSLLPTTDARLLGCEIFIMEIFREVVDPSVIRLYMAIYPTLIL